MSSSERGEDTRDKYKENRVSISLNKASPNNKTAFDMMLTDLLINYFNTKKVRLMHNLDFAADGIFNTHLTQWYYSEPPLRTRLRPEVLFLFLRSTCLILADLCHNFVEIHVILC